MANTSSRLAVSELDFGTIKQNLKDYLGSQSEFTDYDFDGSALSVILDVLSYNTHMNAFYMNMLASEAFLDSAVLRNSVISKASQLGYTPASVRGSRATVNLTITPGDAPTSITIDQYTQFTSTVNGISYTYCTSNAHTVTPVSGNYYANNVELIQGVPLTYQYTVDTSNTEQKFILPNANTDTSQLQVVIQESAVNTNTSAYTLANDVTTVNSTSNVFFLYESSDSKFRVEFGDDNLGRKLSDGNIVKITSTISDGNTTNGANTFTAVGTVGGYSTVSVNTVSGSVGGADRESLSSIQFAAPKHYEAQNRCVTANDYHRIISNEYSGLDSVAIWGGQENDPPGYGKVYIAAKPSGVDTLSTSQKTSLKDLIKKRNMVAVTPVIVDPKKTFVVIDSNVKFDYRKTQNSAAIIANTVANTINTYINTDLAKFETTFRYSQLSKLIDESETSITNNLTTVKLKAEVEDVSTTTSEDYTVNFHNPIYHPHTTYDGAITSTSFSYSDANGTSYESCFLDDSNTTLRVYRYVTGEKTTVSSDVGSVTYANGQVKLTSFSPTSLDGGALSLTVVPESNDITPLRDQLLTANTSEITITTESDVTTTTTTASSTLTSSY